MNQTKAALYIYNGYIPFRTAIGKFITAALAIGSGHSLGPEDPSLQIGASLASALGRRLELSRERLRLLAPVGAAAGLAAAFNAPISAVLFVIEEVIGRWSAGILGSVVLSAVSSVVVVRWFLGSEPLFRIPAVGLMRPTELLAYAILGIVGGLAAVIFAKGIAYFRPRLRAWPRWTQYFQPVGAGLVIGLIGFLGAPQVMGAGYEYMDQAMHDQFTWKMLAILALLKIVATTVSFVTGTPGGMFAPTLFVGAMLGGAVGGVERLFYPSLTGSTATYALVGMGVLFAGFLRVPMTSVFMVLEVSGNYSIVVPVIVANTSGLRDLPRPAAHSDFRCANSPGRPRPALARRAAGANRAARRRCYEACAHSGIECRRFSGASPAPCTGLARQFPGSHESQRMGHNHSGYAETPCRRRQGRNDPWFDSAYSKPALSAPRSHPRSSAAPRLPCAAGPSRPPRRFPPPGRRNLPRRRAGKIQNVR